MSKVKTGTNYSTPVPVCTESCHISNASTVAAFGQNNKGIGINKFI